ncbi:MAG: site-specific integrase [Terriglobales bacterium]|jgi:integrase/recombinase XerD
MATVNLSKRLTVDGKRVFAPPETAGDGVFYLDWYEGTKRRREAIPATTLKQAEQARKDKGLDLAALATGKFVRKDAPAEANRRTLDAAVAEYLQDIKAHKSKKTHAAYSTALDYFQECCTKAFIDQVERRDLLAFKTYLEDKKKQSDRSVWNKFSAVMGFLKSCGRTGKDMGVVKQDWPEYDEETPETYTAKELTKFFDLCTPEEVTWFRFFEYTGMREGEVQHCQWSWIDMDNRTITVQPNKRFDWRPKKNKTRQIPISNPLFQLLTELKKGRDNACDLLFATSGCNIKMDFLDCLKKIAKRGKLNPDAWWLHKFRATFATNVVRKADVATVMSWLGHSDTASTLRYLRPAEGREAQDKINSVFS